MHHAKPHTPRDAPTRRTGTIEVATVDQARSVHLCELAVDFAVRHLKPGGQFVVKVFQGEGFMEFRKQMEAAFASVQVRKPKASRDRSAEVYLLGKGPRRP